MGTARGRVKHGTLHGIRRNGVGCSRFNGETLSFPLTETISYFFFYREMEDIFLLFYYRILSHFKKVGSIDEFRINNSNLNRQRESLYFVENFWTNLRSLTVS